MKDIKTVLRESKDQEAEVLLTTKIRELNTEGYEVSFGKIGVHTTYALLSNKEEDNEIVGYTYLKDMRYYKDNLGKLKALQQAIARKSISSDKR